MSLVYPAEYQPLLRVLNTNLEGSENVPYSFTKIRGVGRRYAMLALKKAEIDPRRRAGSLSPEEVERLVNIMQNPLDFKIPKFFLNRQKDPKTGGYEHVLANDVNSKLRGEFPFFYPSSSCLFLFVLAVCCLLFVLCSLFFVLCSLFFVLCSLLFGVVVVPWLPQSKRLCAASLLFPLCLGKTFIVVSFVWRCWCGSFVVRVCFCAWVVTWVRGVMMCWFKAGASAPIPAV